MSMMRYVLVAESVLLVILYMLYVLVVRVSFLPVDVGVHNFRRIVLGSGSYTIVVVNFVDGIR